MNSKFYKYCVVPQCENTTIKTPKKLFIYVPHKATIRKMWLSLARRDPEDFSPDSVIYFCEDHFDLPNDMENYMKYHIMGFVSQIRLKPGCIPTKFECQSDRRKRTSISTDRSYICNKQQRTIIEEYAHKSIANNIQCSVLENVEVTYETSSGVNKSEDLQICGIADKSVQVYITHKFRSKATQVNKILVNRAVSPLQLLPDSSPFKGGHSLNSSPSVCGLRKETNKLTMEESFKSYKLNRNVSLDTPSKTYSRSNPSIHSVWSGSTDCSQIDEEKQKQQMRETTQNTLKNIMNEPRFYIGVPKNCYYLIDIISNEIQIPKEHVLLCLKKIRLNSKLQELSDEFAITSSYASKIFLEDIPLIASVMRPFIVKLDRQMTGQKLPMLYRHKYCNVSCIIDCLEIEIQRPPKAVIQALTWSEYKQTYTIKYLISCTPNGLVNYISPGFSGRVSDTRLVESCDFIQCLDRGMSVLADRGFKHAEQYLLKFGIKLVRPPRTPRLKTGAKLEKQAKHTPSLRIHIERVKQCIHEFCMLKPYTCIEIKFLKVLDDIVTIACALINLQDMLVK